MILHRSSGHSAKRVISKPEVNNKHQKRINYTQYYNKYTAQFKEQALERADRDASPR
jgi:hypothetical protein